jgi:hypothetical protein
LTRFTVRQRLSISEYPGLFEAVLVAPQSQFGGYRESLPKFLRALNCQVSSCIILVIVLFFWGALPIHSATGEIAVPDPIVTEANLEGEFAAALRKIEAVRKSNHVEQFGCTQYFSNFKRFGQIDPYIEFFKTVGASPIVVDSNHEHYITFEFTREQLASKGYSGFWRGDRLVIVFTTTSASSSKIESFSANVFGMTLP